MITFDAAKKLLDEKNQSQVLRYFDSLSEGEKESLEPGADHLVDVMLGNGQVDHRQVQDPQDQKQHVSA